MFLDEWMDASGQGIFHGEAESNADEWEREAFS